MTGPLGGVNQRYQLVEVGDLDVVVADRPIGRRVREVDRVVGEHVQMRRRLQPRFNLRLRQNTWRRKASGRIRGSFGSRGCVRGSPKGAVAPATTWAPAAPAPRIEGVQHRR